VVFVLASVYMLYFFLIIIIFYSHMHTLFGLYNMLYYVYGFMYVEPFLHPWNETDLVIVCDHFDMLLGSVCKYFVENLCICIH
jgi:hypothetical protein